MPIFTVNDVELFYEESGEGFPLILLHGLMGSSKMYEQEIQHFQAHFRVIALDSRGHGQSSKVRAYTLHDHMKDVIALMDELGIGQAHLLGVSMGSYIAQGVAAMAPARVKKLVLVATKSWGTTSSFQEMLEQHKEELSKLAPVEQFQYLNQYIYHNLDSIREFEQRMLAVGSTLTDEGERLAASKALENFDFRTLLKYVTADALVISGKYDGLNPPDRGRMTSMLLPQATFIEFQHSGHLPNVEERQRFKQEVLCYLLELES